MLLNILREEMVRDTLHVSSEPGSLDFEAAWRLVNGFYPVHAELLIVNNVDLANRNRQVVTVAMRDEELTVIRGEASDIGNRYLHGDMSIIVGLPVLEEVCDILDSETSARHLPQSGVRWLATTARIALIADLL